MRDENQQTQVQLQPDRKDPKKVGSVYLVVETESGRCGHRIGQTFDPFFDVVVDVNVVVDDQFVVPEKIKIIICRYVRTCSKLKTLKTHNPRVIDKHLKLVTLKFTFY